MYIGRKDKGDNLYYRLQEEATAMLQDLSGKIWTDFNAHDPGITILDALHYALLEVQYIFEFPFHEYFFPAAGKPRYGHASSGLYPARMLFAPPVVTAADYERLIIRSLDGVKACRASFEGNRWHFTIEPENNKNRSYWKKQLLDLYHAHRNLCEMPGTVRVDKPDREVPEQNEPWKVPVIDEKRTKPVPQLQGKPSYHSIQHELPGCYGVNEQGIPAGSSTADKAHIRQLQGYLLLFDYLLAGIFDGVNEIPRLLGFSPDQQEKPDNGTLPVIDIPGLDQLTDAERQPGSLYDRAFGEKQRRNYLDLLDKIYGEHTRNLPHREKAIREFIRLNHIRARGCNLYKNSPYQTAAVKRITGILFPGESQAEYPLSNLPGRYNLRIVSDREFFAHHRKMLVDTFIVDYMDGRQQLSECIPHTAVVFHDKQLHRLKKHLHIFWHNILFESFLEYGHHPENYRLVRTGHTHHFLLLYRQPGMKQWLNMGLFFEKETAMQVTNLLWSFLEKLSGTSYPYYLVEDPDAAILTAVFAGWNYPRKKEEKIIVLLRERIPAHVLLRHIRLKNGQIYPFEKHYFAWRKACADKDTAKTQQAGDLLLQFVERLKEEG